MIEFETVQSNLGIWLYRAPVPCGWLVVTCTEGPVRAAPTFVPDPEHLWLPPTESEARDV
jgi:hypothetical protein